MKSTDSTAQIKKYLQSLKLNRIATVLDEELNYSGPRNPDNSLRC